MGAAERADPVAVVDDRRQLGAERLEPVEEVLADADQDAVALALERQRPGLIGVALQAVAHARWRDTLDQRLELLDQLGGLRRAGPDREQLLELIDDQQRLRALDRLVAQMQELPGRLVWEWPRHPGTDAAAHHAQTERQGGAGRAVEPGDDRGLQYLVKGPETTGAITRRPRRDHLEATTRD